MDINKDDYFRVVSTDDSVLHIEWKGFWPDDVAEELGPYFVSQIENAVKTFNGKRFIVLADFSELRALTDITKKYLGQGMKHTLENGLIKGVEIMSSFISKLSVKRAAKETSEEDFRVVVDDMEGAQKVIAEIKKQHNL